MTFPPFNQKPFPWKVKTSLKVKVKQSHVFKPIWSWFLFEQVCVYFFNFDLTYCSLFMNLWPSHLSTKNSFHQELKLALKSRWNNHIFSNLYGVGPCFNRFVPKTIGQWSEVNMVFLEAMCKVYSRSFENKSLSNLLQTRNSYKLDHVNKAFLSGGSTNSLSSMNSSKSFV